MTAERQPEAVADRYDIWLIALSFLMMVATLVLLVVGLFTIRAQARDAYQTHKAVCSYRDSLANAARDSDKYLLAHPNGAPALGITAAQISAQAARQRAAADSLSGLDC